MTYRTWTKGWTRHNNFDSDRPPLEFGVSYDTGSSSPLLTRLGDAASLTVDSTSSPYVSGFDAYMPWAGIKRVGLTEQNGDIVVFAGELDDDGASVYVDYMPKTMVRIPKFWVKFEKVGTVNNLWISPYPIKGYRLHPAFNRFGRVVDNVYVGAFEGVDVGGAMGSSAYLTPLNNLTRVTFRDWADAWGGTPVPGFGWSIVDYAVYSAIQLLYLVEYASFNSQTPSGSTARGGIGEGLVRKGTITKTGYTSMGDADGNPSGHTDLGSSSGKVLVTGDHYAISYRGIENLWGNVWEFMEGIVIDVEGTPWLSQFEKAWGDAAVGNRAVRDTLPIASGYINGITPADYSFLEQCQLFPYNASGGSSTTYMCDYYQMVTYATVNHTVITGGGYDLGADSAHGGIFAWYTGHNVQTNGKGTNTGARLQFVPYDYTDYYRY